MILLQKGDRASFVLVENAQDLGPVNECLPPDGCDAVVLLVPPGSGRDLERVLRMIILGQGGVLCAPGEAG